MFASVNVEPRLARLMEDAQLTRKDITVPYFALLSHKFLGPNMHLGSSTWIPVNPICHGLPEDEFYGCWKKMLPQKKSERKTLYMDLSQMDDKTQKECVMAVLREITTFLTSVGDNPLKPY